MRIFLEKIKKFRFFPNKFSKKIFSRLERHFGINKYKEICTTNKNCTSFDYCFAQETNDFELFNCYMKGNTFSETILKTPNHCVKSIKENCSIVDN